VRIRKHLSYANVVATLALVMALGGGAYAINRVNSRQIVNGTIRSVDLKNRKGVRAADVKRNGLRGKQIDERTLDASPLVPVAGDEAVDCDLPSSHSFIKCATISMALKAAARVLVIATGSEESVGFPARAICEVRVDGLREALPVQPGEETSDNTSGSATNGFARTVVLNGPLPKGRHEVALACKEFTGDVRIDVPTIAAIAISSR
jgi:hypothetical protein